MYFLSSCFSTAVSELSGHETECMIHKPKIFTVWSFKKKNVPILVLDSWDMKKGIA